MKEFAGDEMDRKQRCCCNDKKNICNASVPKLDELLKNLKAFFYNSDSFHMHKNTRHARALMNANLSA